MARLICVRVGRVGEKIHNNKITTDNWRRFADRNKETGNKGQNKQTKRRGISRTQDAEHKRRTITIHCLSYANMSQEAWINGIKILTSM
jgi:hypothetical protein